MTTNLDSLNKICNDITEARKFCIRLNIIKITIDRYKKDRIYYTEVGEQKFYCKFGKYSDDKIKKMVIDLYKINKPMIDEIKVIINTHKHEFIFL